MTTLNLHAEALADLRRSGLSDATIAEAGLYTPAPGDLPRFLSARLVGQVQHIMVFPYESVGHGGLWRRDDEFVRCKLFPAVSDGEGHTIRYYQRAGTPPRLYVPVPARVALADPRVPLLITEGEKKALKVNQEGLACVAVGGLWNWQVGGRPLADLDRIDWCERETLIVPDSDAWTRPDLLQPVFALGKELEGRGAKVSVVKLPAGPDGAKVGLDDYLCAHARQAFDDLPRLGLKHPALTRMATWWREWSRRKEPGEPEAAQSVLEMLERGETVRFLHPALDVVDGVLFYGVPVGDKLTIVTSRHQGFTPETMPAGLTSQCRHDDEADGRVQDDIRQIGRPEHMVVDREPQGPGHRTRDDPLDPQPARGDGRQPHNQPEAVAVRLLAANGDGTAVRMPRRGARQARRGLADQKGAPSSPAQACGRPEG